MTGAPILHRDVPARIAGLDLSTARVGLATTTGELLSLVPRTGPNDRGRRLAEIRDLVDRALLLHPPRPDLVVIEGYSLGSPNRSTLLTLGEVGGAVRCRLFELDIAYVEVPPSSVKRFATGAGNADKYRMIQAAIDLGARGSVNDDEADAFHLRRMGRAAHGLEFGLQAHELDALANCGVSW